MIQHVKHWLAPPIFPTDEVATRRASLLNVALVNVMVFGPVFILGNTLGGRTPAPVFVINAVAVVLCLVLRGWMHRSRVQLASIGLLIVGFVLTTASAASLGTIRAPTTAIYLLLVITAGLLFDLRGMLAASALCSLVIGGLIVAENAGRLPRPDYTVTITQWIAYTAICGWTGSLTLSALQALRQALARADRAVAERQRAEEALRESEERYRSLFENSVDAILLTAPDGSIFAANPAACRMFGRTEAEIVQAGRAGVIDATDPRLPPALDERMRTGCFSGELTFMRKDGSRFPGEITTAVFSDERGNARTSMIIRDITRRKRAEEEQRESEERLRMVLESSLDNLYRRNLETDTYDYISPAIERISGYSVEEMLSMPLESVVSMMHPDDIDRVKRVIEELMTGARASYLLEYRFRHKDGQYRWLSDLFTVVRDAQGRPLYLVGNVRDITERKCAEEKLKESEFRFRTLIDQSPVAISVSRDGISLYANPKLLQMLGLQTAEEVVGRPTTEYFALPYREESKERSRRRSLGLPVPSEFESVGLRKDGSEFPVQVTTAKVELVDGPANLAIVTDSAEHKRAEERIRREAARAEALARIAARLNAQLDLDAVLNAVCEETAHALDVPVASVALYRPESQAFVPTAVFGLAPQALQDIAPLSHAFYQALFGPMEPFTVVPDLQAVPDSINAGFYARHDLRSTAAVGLIREGDLVGVLSIHAVGQPRAFDADELGLLKAIADTAAVAAENARLYEVVNAGQEQLRQLTNYLQAAREDERAYVAREIHDEFGQTLTGLKMDLSWLARRLPQRRTDLAIKISAMEGLVDGAINTVRRIATELRPGLLDDLGLVAAIEWQTQDFGRRTGLAVELRLDGEDLTLERDVATALFRILQEALTNIARHAGATRVEVELDDQPGLVTLIVRDNGRGIAPAQISAPRSLGLLGMRERARAFGGELTVAGSPEQGTTVTVRIPRRAADL